MIREIIKFTTEDGKIFSSLQEAEEHEKNVKSTNIINNKLTFIKRTLSTSVYGHYFQDPTFKNQEYTKVAVQILLQNTDLIEKIINHLKTNKWD